MTDWFVIVIDCVSVGVEAAAGTGAVTNIAVGYSRPTVTILLSSCQLANTDQRPTEMKHSKSESFVRFSLHQSVNIKIESKLKSYLLEHIMYF